MPDPIITTIVAGLSKGAADLLVKSTEKLSLSLAKIFKESNAKASIDLSPHLKANLERCMKVKTLLNKVAPANIVDIYVTTKFVMGKAIVNDNQLVDEIELNKRLVITGTGGGGKTMFMRFLWLAVFTGQSGRVPIYVELRRLNELTTEDLLTYVYRSIVGTAASLPENVFYEAARKGAFTLILDGFDEITSERKEKLEKQILRFAYENPEALIIVSGRPDSRFSSWQSFFVVQVMPMEKSQVIDLIGKFDYDRSTRENFSRKVEAGLYEKHQSFMSNPLLATMMMLTFDQFADIPEKIFVFYDQAFDTLYSKHDATKEGFKRQHAAGMSIDTFKKCLSYFCLASYVAEKFEFSETELLIYTNRAFKMASVTADPSHFVQDMTEAVCLLQEEGLVYVFAHRSFQEYFAAYCLAYFIEEQFSKCIMRLMSRSNDNVLRMLFEMNQYKFESKFILPTLSDINTDIKSHDLKNRNLINTAQYLSLVAGYSNMMKYEIMSLEGNDKFLFLQFTVKLYKSMFQLANNTESKMNFDDEKAIENYFKKFKIRADLSKPYSVMIIENKDNKVHGKKRDNFYVMHFEHLVGSGLEQRWIAIWKNVERLFRDVNARVGLTEQGIDEFLQLEN